LTGILVISLTFHRIAAKGKHYAEQLKQKVAQNVDRMQKTMREQDPGQTAGNGGKTSVYKIPDEFVCEKCGTIMSRNIIENGCITCPDCGQSWRISDFVGDP
ncbi:MAG TPA: hypothetical protein VKK79_24695, partial [Candidatus Lokiarchaeia archaeon]|nr:hypothetical protein [Candidatus Lokiarchaeia archaeon]